MHNTNKDIRENPLSLPLPPPPPLQLITVAL